MSVSERSEALFLCPKFKRYFGVFTGSEGLGDIPTSRMQASVYTDALLAKNAAVKSFSSRNLLYMHQFYRMYPDALITPQVGAQLTEEEFAHQNGAQLHKDIWAGIFGIPWGHHKLILDKCKDDQSTVSI